MHNTTVSRRQALKGIGGSAALVSLSGCSALPGGGSEFESQMETLRTQYQKYDNNIEAALSDGYTAILGPMVPGMGWHLINREEGQRQIEEGFDPETPNGLLYDNERNLGGVEWSFPAESVGTPDIFADDNVDAQERWKVHEAASHVYANGNGEQTNREDLTVDDMFKNQNWAEFLPARRDLEAGQTLDTAWGRLIQDQSQLEDTEERVIDFVTHHPDLLNLTAWVFAENENGMMAETHPEFAQL